MTEPINDLPRPELCTNCREARGEICIRSGRPCNELMMLWDSGYAAGKAACREERTLLAASLKQADATTASMGELDASYPHYLLQQRAEAAESKLARVTGVFQAWSVGDEPEGQPSTRRTLLQIGSILDEYAEPEGS